MRERGGGRMERERGREKGGKRGRERGERGEGERE